MKTTVKGIASEKRRKDFLREIRQIVDQIVDHFSPSKVILFGSHARGRPVRDSGGFFPARHCGIGKGAL